MKPHIKIDVTAGTLASMTVEQFQSLQRNVMSEGSWDSIDVPVRVSGGESLIGVHLPASNGPDFFLGIESDGYAHS